MRILTLFKRATCNHLFNYQDLVLTGIKEPEKPKTRDYKELQEYLKNLFDMKQDHNSKRIYCECRKCDKGFYVHCGLDLKRITSNDSYIDSLGIHRFKKN